MGKEKLVENDFIKLLKKDNKTVALG